MIPSHLRVNVMSVDESPYKAYYYLRSFIHYPIVIVIDSDDKVCGIVTLADFDKFMWQQGIGALEGYTLGDICIRQFRYIYHDDDIYSQARNIFSDTSIESALPILDDNNHLVGLIAKWQVFFLDFYRRSFLHHMPYATLLMQSVTLAKRLNYKKISVLEFGVAGGGYGALIVTRLKLLV